MTLDYLIALGSNSGDRLTYLASATSSIAREIGVVSAFSYIYETKPIGPADQAFLNAALICQSDLGPVTVLDSLLDIELCLGRTRLVRWGNRTIDLDIVLIQDQSKSLTVENERLIVPHKECLQRDFVLKPAADIAKSWLHPESGLTIGEHLQAVPMQSITKKRGLLKPLS
jgi:2-amino-4-hydroxy-6-hydroxymethyldihydropteridine diphosphokinase